MLQENMSENTNRNLDKEYKDYIENLMQEYNNLDILTSKDVMNVWTIISTQDEMFKSLSFEIMISENPKAEGFLYENYKEDFSEDVQNSDILSSGAKDILSTINNFLDMHNSTSNDPATDKSDMYYIEYNEAFYNLWIKAYLFLCNEVDVQSNSEGICILVKLLHSMLTDDKIMLITDMCTSFPN